MSNGIDTKAPIATSVTWMGEKWNSLMKKRLKNRELIPQPRHRRKAPSATLKGINLDTTDGIEYHAIMDGYYAVMDTMRSWTNTMRSWTDR